MSHTAIICKIRNSAMRMRIRRDAFRDLEPKKKKWTGFFERRKKANAGKLTRWPGPCVCVFAFANILRRRKNFISSEGRRFSNGVPRDRKGRTFGNMIRKRKGFWDEPLGSGPDRGNVCFRFIVVGWMEILF